MVAAGIEGLVEQVRQQAERARQASAAAGQQRRNSRHGTDRYVTGGVNWDGYSLESLQHMVAEQASPEQLKYLATSWREHGQQVSQTGQDLQRSLNTVLQYWSGSASQEAARTVTDNAAWVTRMGQTATALASPIEDASGALSSAQHSMPGKPHSSWGANVGGGAAAGMVIAGPIGAAFGAAIGGIASAFGFGSNKKKLKRQAVQTMQRFENAVVGIDSNTPQFGNPADGVNSGANPIWNRPGGITQPGRPPSPPGGTNGPGNATTPSGTGVHVPPTTTDPSGLIPSGPAGTGPGVGLPPGTGPGGNYPGGSGVGPGGPGSGWPGGNLPGGALPGSRPGGAFGGGPERRWRSLTGGGLAEEELGRARGRGVAGFGAIGEEEFGARGRGAGGAGAGSGLGAGGAGRGSGDRERGANRFRRGLDGFGEREEAARRAGAGSGYGAGAGGAARDGEEDGEHRRRVPIEEDPFAATDLKAAPPVIGL